MIEEMGEAALLPLLASDDHDVRLETLSLLSEFRARETDEERRSRRR